MVAPTLAVKVTVLPVVTGFVATLNVAELAPAGTMMDPGGIADALLEESLTTVS